MLIRNTVAVYNAQLMKINNQLKKVKYITVLTVLSNSPVNFANSQPLEGSELRGTLHRGANKQGLLSTPNMLTINTPYLGYAGRQTVAQMSGGVTMFLGILDPDTGGQVKIRITS